jgi:hypothetical protein
LIAQRALVAHDGPGGEVPDGRCDHQRMAWLGHERNGMHARHKEHDMVMAALQLVVGGLYSLQETSRDRPRLDDVFRARSRL